MAEASVPSATVGLSAISNAGSSFRCLCGSLAPQVQVKMRSTGVCSLLDCGILDWGKDFDPTILAK